MRRHFHTCKKLQLILLKGNAGIFHPKPYLPVLCCKISQNTSEKSYILDFFRYMFIYHNLTHPFVANKASGSVQKLLTLSLETTYGPFIYDLLFITRQNPCLEANKVVENKEKLAFFLQHASQTSRFTISAASPA